MIDVVQTSSASKHAPHEPQPFSDSFLSLSLSHAFSNFCYLSHYLRCESHFSRLNSPFILFHFLFIFQLQLVSFSTTVSPTCLHCSLLIVSPCPPIFCGVRGVKEIETKRNVGRYRERERENGMGRDGDMIGLEEPPWCQKFTCKTSLLPPLFSSVFTASPPPVLSSFITPPHLSLLPYLSSFPSLSFCLLSSCIAPSALWCSSYNQNSAHKCTDLETHTHRGRHTHTTSGSPPPSLTPFCCRHETFYNPWCASASSRDTTFVTSNSILN